MVSIAEQKYNYIPLFYSHTINKIGSSKRKKMLLVHLVVGCIVLIGIRVQDFFLPFKPETVLLLYKLEIAFCRAQLIPTISVDWHIKKTTKQTRLTHFEMDHDDAKIWPIMINI